MHTIESIGLLPEQELCQKSDPDGNAPSMIFNCTAAELISNVTLKEVQLVLFGTPQHWPTREWEGEVHTESETPVRSTVQQGTSVPQFRIGHWPLAMLPKPMARTKIKVLKPDPVNRKRGEVTEGFMASVW
jgi:hypothetical protein